MNEWIASIVLSFAYFIDTYILIQYMTSVQKESSHFEYHQNHLYEIDAT